MKNLFTIIVLLILLLNANRSNNDQEDEKAEIYSRVYPILSTEKSKRTVEFNRILNSFKQSIDSLKQQDSTISDDKSQVKIRREISVFNRCMDIVTFFQGAYFPPSGTGEFVKHIPLFNVFSTTEIVILIVL